jgi:chromosome segregation ATPase
MLRRQQRPRINAALCPAAPPPMMAPQKRRLRPARRQRTQVTLRQQSYAPVDPMAQEPTNGQILEAIIGLRDGMAENFAVVYKKLEEHDRRFDEHDRRFDEHDRRFDEHDRRFDNLDRRMGRLETRIEDLERRLPA